MKPKTPRWMQDAWSFRSRILKEFSNPQNMKVLDLMAQELAQAFIRGNKVLACGNGGSACDAMHFCEELTGQYKKKRKALPALSLLDASHLTCVANDYGFDSVFQKGVEAFGQAGDVLLAISTSGNSANILKAVKYAQKEGLVVVALLGKDGGKLKGKADLEIIVPAMETEYIQEIHIKCIHTLIEAVERILFPELYTK